MPSISPSSRFTMRRLRAGIRSNLLFRFTTTIAVIGEPWRKIYFKELRASAPKKPIIRENDVPALLADQSSIGQDVYCAELVVDNAIGAASFLLRHFITSLFFYLPRKSDVQLAGRVRLGNTPLQQLSFPFFQKAVDFYD